MTEAENATNRSKMEGRLLSNYLETTELKSQRNCRPEDASDFRIMIPR